MRLFKEIAVKIIIKLSIFLISEIQNKCWNGEKWPVDFENSKIYRVIIWINNSVVQKCIHLIHTNYHAIELYYFLKISFVKHESYGERLSFFVTRYIPIKIFLMSLIVFKFSKIMFKVHKRSTVVINYI